MRETFENRPARDWLLLFKARRYPASDNLSPHSRETHQNATRSTRRHRILQNHRSSKDRFYKLFFAGPRHPGFSGTFLRYFLPGWPDTELTGGNIASRQHRKCGATNGPCNSSGAVAFAVCDGATAEWFGGAMALPYATDHAKGMGLIKDRSAAARPVDRFRS
jgi:hypothetical protein